MTGVLVITQARFNSSRLRGKVLKKIGQKTLLEIHLERILRSNKMERVVLATTTQSHDDPLVDLAKNMGVSYFRGHEEDVLDRFYQTALPYRPRYIVRLTADCPLIDPALIDSIIQYALENEQYDYVSNVIDPTYPDGLDIEVFKFSALEKTWSLAKLRSDREHVTPFIRTNSYGNQKQFHSFSIKNEEDYSSFRLTVDEQEDLELIRLLVNELGDHKPWMDYVRYVKAHPRLMSINGHYERNAGYIESLKNN